MFQVRRRLTAVTLATASAALGIASLAAESRPGDVTTVSAPALATYLVVYRRGSRWVDGRPMAEQQGLREHFAYYVALHRTGRLVSAGGFSDESGGAAVCRASDDAAAAAFVAADPAVTRGVFRYELQRWTLMPWEEISNARAIKE